LSLWRCETTDGWGPLLAALKERHDHNLGLRELVFRSCPTDGGEAVLKIRELVEVRWDVAGSDDEVTGEGPDPERSHDSGDDNDVCESYRECTLSG